MGQGPSISQPCDAPCKGLTGQRYDDCVYANCHSGGGKRRRGKKNTKRKNTKRKNTRKRRTRRH